MYLVYMYNLYTVYLSLNKCTIFSRVGDHLDLCSLLSKVNAAD